mmetsp:Transcript_50787/g.124776  ORF Transcript_50787/g.124776 Transcript_50787/m.124776 type:complete len:115 (+) Transcript_50787:60-404(+)
MASSGSSETIQTLLEAEKEAATVVERARKEREARIKQAAVEAEAEINAYRATKEAEYKAEVEKYQGSSGDSAKQIAADTERLIKETSTGAAQKRDEVISMLVKFVTTVDTSYEK